MNAVDIALGLVAGIVSCLTPESLLLLPLVVGAAGAANRPGLFALAIGLGLAVVMSSALAGLLGTFLGLEAAWSRRFICALLILQGMLLMSASTIARFARLTGGEPSLRQTRAAMFSGVTFRLFLLSLLVGANWKPSPTPVLGRGLLMAAVGDNPAPSLGILVAFGIGAALPWIAAGRVIRLAARPVVTGLADSLAGKRVLGLTLLVVGVVGMSGQDVIAAKWIDARLPAWTRDLATRF
jgi:cytochrome c-type biogenesis protein